MFSITIVFVTNFIAKFAKICFSFDPKVIFFWMDKEGKIRQLIRQTNKPTGGKADKHTEVHADKQRNILRGRLADRQISR